MLARNMLRRLSQWQTTPILLMLAACGGGGGGSSGCSKATPSAAMVSEVLSAPAAPELAALPREELETPIEFIQRGDGIYVATTSEDRTFIDSLSQDLQRSKESNSNQIMPSSPLPPSLTIKRLNSR